MPAVVNSCWTDRPGLSKTPAMAARSHKITLSASAKAALASSTDFGRMRLVRQRQQIQRLADGIGVPLITLPRLATPRLTLHQLGELADALVGPMIGATS